jgi:chromosome segregation ATPase
MASRTTRRGLLRGVAGGLGAVGAAGAATAEVSQASRTADSPAGNPPETRVLGDEGYTHLGYIVADANRYDVLRYDNRFQESAGGIDVYSADDERLTEEDVATPVLADFAWSEDVARLLDNEVPSTAADVVDQTTTIESQLDAPQTAIDEMVNVIDELDNLSIQDYSAWDLAKDAYPSLSTLESMLNTIDEELDSWVEASGSVNDAVPPLVDFLEGVANPAESDFDTAEDRITAASSALGELQRTASDLEGDINDAISEARNIDDEIDNAVDQIVSQAHEIGPLVGGAAEAARGTIDSLTNTLESGIESLIGAIDPLLQPIREFESSVSETAATIEPEAPDRQQELLQKWKRRQRAALQVPASIVMVGVFGLGAYLWSLTEPGASQEIWEKLAVDTEGGEES